MYGILITKKDKILNKIHKVNRDLQTLTTRGASWNFNLTTGECEFIGPKLSEEEKTKVEELKAQLKQLETELKIVEMEKDFEEEKEDENRIQGRLLFIL